MYNSKRAELKRSNRYRANVIEGSSVLLQKMADYTVSLANVRITSLRSLRDPPVTKEC